MPQLEKKKKKRQASLSISQVHRAVFAVPHSAPCMKHKEMGLTGGGGKDSRIAVSDFFKTEETAF